MTEPQYLKVGQDVRFQPSVSTKIKHALDAVVKKVWSSGCVDLVVTYPFPAGTKEETSVLVCWPHQSRPTAGGYYCYPEN